MKQGTLLTAVLSTLVALLLLPSLAQATNPDKAIVVYDASDSEVAVFKTAKCRVVKRSEGDGGKRFRADAKSPTGWRLEVYGNQFQGFGQEYEIDYGIKETNFALYPTAANSPFYSNLFFPSDDVPPFNGLLAFSGNGKDMGLGSIAAFISSGGEDAVRVVGHAKCKYPKKKR